MNGFDMHMAAPAKLPRALVWFRRDLRIEDNPALLEAAKIAEEVIPIYIYSPEEEGQFQPGRCSRWWLSNALQALDTDLQSLGSQLLCFRASEARHAIASLVTSLGVHVVVFNHLYDPISMVRDNEVKMALAMLGVLCYSFNGDVLREPWEIIDSNARPYTCYKDFWEAHSSSPPMPPLPAPSSLPPITTTIPNALPINQLGIMSTEEELSNAQLEYHWSPGSTGAHKLLEDFVQGRLRNFNQDRAKTDRNSTSRLSPYIHYGELSVRTVAAAATAAAAPTTTTTNSKPSVDPASVADFLRQLGYREYSRYLSFHFPFTHERPLLEHLRAVPWRYDQSLFKAWRTGNTGFPLIDAGMREVWSTGWLHNRIRVVAASFMVKHLLLPWKWGLKHYWDVLLDADLECDALGWQYCSGCLIDGHNFSELVDIATESRRFDPNGNYVRRWLPVLARLPAKYIHEPWTAPPEILVDAGVELGVNYPWPVIDVDEAAAALEVASSVVAAAAVNAVTVAGVDISNGGTAEGVVVNSDPALISSCLAATVVTINNNNNSNNNNNNNNNVRMQIVQHGPYKPGTKPDPAAAAKVWGPASTLNHRTTSCTEVVQGQNNNNKKKSHQHHQQQCDFGNNNNNNNNTKAVHSCNHAGGESSNSAEEVESNLPMNGDEEMNGEERRFVSPGNNGTIPAYSICNGNGTMLPQTMKTGHIHQHNTNNNNQCGDNDVVMVAVAGKKNGNSATTTSDNNNNNSGGNNTNNNNNNNTTSGQPGSNTMMGVMLSMSEYATTNNNINNNNNNNTSGTANTSIQRMQNQDGSSCDQVDDPKLFSKNSVAAVPHRMCDDQNQHGHKRARSEMNE